MSGNFLGNNIKFLRKRKKLTQSELAGKLAITRSKLNCIELGQTKSPTLNDLLQFSEVFGLSIDTLIKTDLSGLPENQLAEMEAGTEQYLGGNNLRVLTISVDKQNRENIEDVPVSAQAGYIEGFSDPEFIGALPKFSLPDLPEKGTFRRFPVTGDSMLIEPGSKVIAQFITDWRMLNKATPCIVILRSAQRPMFKLVTIKDNRPEVLLESLNPAHTPFTVNTRDIAELWKFHSYSSNKLPDVSQNVRGLYSMMKEIKEELKKRETDQ